MDNRTRRMVAGIVAALVVAAAAATAIGVRAAVAAPAAELTRATKAEARADALARQLIRERAKVAMYRRRALAMPLHTGDQDIAAGYAARLAEAVYGVNAGKLLRIAECESGTQAYTRGRYRGWLQYDGPTWAGGPLAAFSPHDPVAAFLQAAWYINRGEIGRWPVCGRR